MTRISTGLIMAGVMILVGVAAVAGRKLGILDSHGSLRLFMAALGLQIVVSANLIPKAGGAVSGRRLAVRRAAGWSLLAAGLGYMAAWLFAPWNLAADLSMAPVALAVTGVVAYCAWGRMRPPAQG